MSEYYKTINRMINVLMDYFVLNISWMVVYNLSHHAFYPWMPDKSPLNLILILNLLWLLASNVVGLYRHSQRGPLLVKPIKTLILYIFLTCYVLIVINNEEIYHIDKESLFYATTLFGCLLWLGKYCLYKTAGSSLMIYGETRKAIMLTEGKNGMDFYNRFEKEMIGYELLGLFDDTKPAAEGFVYLGKIDACMTYVIEHKVDEIFCALDPTKRSTLESLIKEAGRNMVRFRLVPQHFDYLQILLPDSLIKGNALSLRYEPLENIFNRIAKRIFDLIFSLLVIVLVLSWLFPIIYILIKMESPGPVFFVQPRSGRDNTTFSCFKFRSMRVNAHADHLQATKDDSRITRIGAFLRKTSLDEMPQFFNVLLGDMSVVGPRPHMLKHTEEYANLIDHFMVRHFIKPGITGWAQINGLRGETKLLDAMRARVEADIWYMQNWSFDLDLKIIFSTFFKTIKGDKYAF
ncbi:undecaprenyl-phosphate glucose phosphotransferase [Mucilaginibacter sabulilitoris]|uniref:Undecaprenyl-phosphate glucose phosphotransferase n=1 Tax=Mucilaginibacter sabulilitoris TaxID=1173583 RepID=A0ABZ0TV73_9SPHI|nr:undecaprenyl-phosphate glucose phosphotransferase [Mucilaginibacter sabulilitoris]WPU95689.1 undecaprenyl-phosphate glucose phosphotransferase [Mucilaginibacter sabulilitoris]